MIPHRVKMPVCYRKYAVSFCLLCFLLPRSVCWWVWPFLSNSHNNAPAPGGPGVHLLAPSMSLSVPLQLQRRESVMFVALFAYFYSIQITFSLLYLGIISVAVWYTRFLYPFARHHKLEHEIVHTEQGLY